MPRKKLRDIATALGLNVGCGDNSCIWGSPGGMATNGGCRCHKGAKAGGFALDERVTMLQMQRVALHLLDVYNVLHPE
jgi:hypothetical protein